MSDQPSRLLSDAERDRFATYCEQEAHSYGELATQMEKLPGTHYEVLVKQMKLDAFAHGRVAQKLRSVEPMTLSKPTPSATVTRD